MRVAIVGAGIAGLSCASVLARRGVSVRVFDKGRGPAGRMSTRRAVVPFDHGAQYFTTRDPHFSAEIARLMNAGVVAEWRPRIVAVDRVGSQPNPVSNITRLVGVPGMNAVAQALAAPLDVQTSVTVSAVERRDEGWQLSAANDELPGHFDAVVLTAPPVQTAGLLGDHPMAGVVGGAEMAPCWAVMASWDEAIDVPFDAAFVNDGPLGWIARDGSKPGRPHPHAWVIHASPAWSTEHLELAAEDVLPQLLSAFEAITGGPLPPPAFATAHRWRYASIVRALDDTHLWDPDSRLGVAGDWCGGSRVEGGWLSGHALARAILAA